MKKDDVQLMLSGISPETPRDLKSFRALMCEADRILREFELSRSQLQRSIIADSILFAMQGGGWAGRLPFSYEEAYLAVGIPKEFLE